MRTPEELRAMGEEIYTAICMNGISPAVASFLTDIALRVNHLEDKLASSEKVELAASEPPSGGAA